MGQSLEAACAEVCVQFRSGPLEGESMAKSGSGWSPRAPARLMSTATQSSARTGRATLERPMDILVGNETLSPLYS
jgi:hypothetical protein